MATGDKILLGTGVFTIGGTAVGLTRGGGSFVVEREYRNIEADGDRGPVEGRVVIDTEVAKITINGLELFDAASMVKYYPGVSVTAATTPGTGKDVTGTLSVAAGDYVDVTWTGTTKDGKDAIITLENCLNLANLEWGLEDKSETVPSLEYTAHYAEASRTTPPWKVYFET